MKYTSKFINQNFRIKVYGISSYFQNAATYGSHGVKDDPTRKFDNFFGGTVHKKLTAAFQDITAGALMRAA